MMTRLLLVVGVALALAELGSAKVWDRCELARTLLTHNIPRKDLATWVCIASRESNYHSEVISKPLGDGTRFYGLFQISNAYWCTSAQSPKPNENRCKVSCDSLLNSIDGTISCIKTMYAQSKNTWDPWKSTYEPCKSQVATFLNGCNI